VELNLLVLLKEKNVLLINATVKQILSEDSKEVNVLIHRNAVTIQMLKLLIAQILALEALVINLTFSHVEWHVHLEDANANKVLLKIILECVFHLKNVLNVIVEQMKDLNNVVQHVLEFVVNQTQNFALNNALLDVSVNQDLYYTKVNVFLKNNVTLFAEIKQ
jgi:hypothetical protein